MLFRLLFEFEFAVVDDAVDGVTAFGAVDDEAVDDVVVDDVVVFGAVDEAVDGVVVDDVVVDDFFFVFVVMSSASVVLDAEPDTEDGADIVAEPLSLIDAPMDAPAPMDPPPPPPPAAKAGASISALASTVVLSKARVFNVACIVSLSRFLPS